MKFGWDDKLPLDFVIFSTRSLYVIVDLYKEIVNLSHTRDT